MNWPTALTSIGLWLSGARAHGGQRAGLGLMRGPQAITLAEALLLPLQACVCLRGRKAADAVFAQFHIGRRPNMSNP